MTRKGKEKDSSKPDRATWTPEMERLLIKALLVEIHNGRKAENGHGMTKEGWQNAHAAFNKHSKQPLELMQIKNKANALKKEFAVFSAIKESGEFTWDDATGTPTASNEVWDRYVEANPIAKKYRGRALSNYPLLSQLVSTTPLSPTTLSLTLTPESLPIKRSRAGSSSSGDDGGGDRFDEAEDQPTSDSEGEGEDTTPTVKTPAPVPTSGATNPSRSLKRIKRNYTGEIHNLAIANALTTIAQTLELSPPPHHRASSAPFTPAAATAAPPSSSSPAPNAVGPVDNIQYAITTLQNDYDKKMTVKDLVAGFSIFESELKAKMFVAMKKGTARDAWLEREIQVYRQRVGDLML